MHSQISGESLSSSSVYALCYDGVWRSGVASHML